MKKIIKKTILLLAILNIVIPVITMVIWSFKSNYQYFDLRGWSYVFKNNSRFLMSLKNSVLIATLTTLVTVVISIPCAKALAFEDFKGKKLVSALVFSPVVIPAVAIGMGLDMQFIRMGLSGTYLGIVLVTIVPCLPYTVNLIKEVFILTGRGYIEQAYTLGASKKDVVLKIILPMIMPGIVSASMMAYIVAFSQYFLVYLIGGGEIITFTMEMFPFIQSGDRLMGSVYGVVFVLSTVIMLGIMEYILKKIYKMEDCTYV